MTPPSTSPLATSSASSASASSTLAEAAPLASSIEAAFDIQDPEIDTEALMRVIQERIRQRSKDAIAQGQHYGVPVGLNGVRKLSTELYKSVEQTRGAASAIRVPLVVTSDGASSMPLIGGLVQRVRRALHQVSVFYVNLLADRQIAFNRAASDSVRKLTTALDQTNMRVEALEREIAELRDQQTSGSGR